MSQPGDEAEIPLCGEPLTAAEWRRLRAYRLDRVQRALEAAGFAAAVLFDPCNVRYATGSRNMAVWTLHNPVRYAFVPAEGLPTLFEFGAKKWPVAAQSLETLSEVRRPVAWTHFYAGSAKQARAATWADEITALVREQCGGETRVAFDHLDPIGLRELQARRLTVEDGEALMERARLIKSAEEVRCIRASIAVAELGIGYMREALRPGITENELWAILHHTNIAHGGEWIETRLMSSGPRTNPWMQESSNRVIQAGDLVAFDTDMIGPNGYCADVSRTFLCAPAEPNAEQRHLYRSSHQQLAHNAALLEPGRTLREVIEQEWVFPAEYFAYRYGFAHGVGLKDEYPFLPNKADLDDLGDPDLVLEPGMVLSLESYIGAVGGREGVKLEDQVLITEDGHDVLSSFPFEEELL